MTTEAALDIAVTQVAHRDTVVTSWNALRVMNRAEVARSIGLALRRGGEGRR
jgi:hypothetical protein